MRKINFFTGIIMLLIPFTFYFCSKDKFQDEQPGEIQNYTSEELMLIEEYNENVSLFAQAVSKSLGNKEFRKLIKSEALKMFDGDYDVLIRNIVDKPLVSAVGKSSYTVKDLLEENHPLYEETRNKSGNSLIDEMQELYPNLQIAVPVHAEEWDENSYIPDVAFQEAVNAGTQETISAFSSSGEIKQLDAVNAPVVPVIVVGISERVIDPPEIDPDDPLESPTPTSLTGSATAYGIHISWNMPAEASYSNTKGYKIYRQDPTGNTYTRIATIYGLNNKSYNDNNVERSKTYSYYVTSHCLDYESPASNTKSVTAPDYPEGVESFVAIYDYPGEVELRWDNNHGQYFDQTNLRRRVYGINADYVDYKTFTANDVHYFDRNNITGGKTIKYQIRHAVDEFESNALYDMVKVPYRDVSQGTAIYIKKMQFNFNDIAKLERWHQGRPEFIVTLCNVDESPGSTPVKVNSQRFDFSSRHPSETFPNSSPITTDWKPGFWWDKMTFNVVEWDWDIADNFEFDIGVGANFKDVKNESIELKDGAVNMKLTFNSEVEDCGTSWYDYFENPDRVLQFPNYDFKLTVSDR